MNHLTKLLIAAGLAAIAAIANLSWLTVHQSKPELYVAVRNGIERNVPLSQTLLQPVAIPGEAETLRKTYIPWEARAEILEFPAPRSYDAGEVVMRHQILETTDRLKTVGPFRVVGEESRGGKAADEDRSSSRQGVVLVEVSDAQNNETRGLMELLVANTGHTKRKSSIVAVQLVKSASARSPETAAMVLQPVSLRGLDHVPDDIRPGEWIRFVVSE